jgi:transposase
MGTTPPPGSTPTLLRPTTTPHDLETRRRLGVKLVLQGYAQVEVARMLEVDRRSVSNWMRWYRQSGDVGLKARPIPGAESKLTPVQEETVLGWLKRDATEFGFRTSLWTSTRVTQLIRERFGITYNANYFCRWLTRHDFTPQVPRSVAAQRDESAVAAYARAHFEPLVKKVGPSRLISF